MSYLCIDLYNITMNIYIALTVGLSALTSLAAVHWIYFKILKLAKNKDLVDNPDARKLQKVPVPVVGGLAVFFGIIFGALMAAGLLHIWQDELVSNGQILHINHLLPVLMGMSVMLYVGALDDIVGLSPKVRFVIEILVILGLVFSTGACIDSLHGMWGVEHFSLWVAVPLTVLAGVGIINAVNMIDGVNGLSSGLCITYCLLFGTIFILIGDVTNAILAFTMAASLWLFFVHNVFGSSSRMFIGDAGTMVMGILMTWFVMNVTQSNSYTAQLDGQVNIVAMVVAFLAVPVADTLRVMTMRMAKRMSPFNPDKTHLHHAFVAMGISHSITTLSIIIINLIVVGVWALTVLLDAPLDCQFYAVVIVAAILVWGTYIFLNHEKASNSKKAQWLRHISVKTHFGKKEWWQRLSYYLDAPEFDEHVRKDLKRKLEYKFIHRASDRESTENGQ